MKKGLIYIHGKGGNASEAEGYKKFFPDHDIVGFDYHSLNPWDAKEEFPDFFDSFSSCHEDIIIVAGSIGAYFALCSFSDKQISDAYFISPVVNMERLILDMMGWAGISEQELMEKGIIEVDSGEPLSWDYLSWVRENPVVWKADTHILYGEKDALQSYDTIMEFSRSCGADVTVMKGGEHWFHTEEQMKFLDEWMREKTNK